MVCSLQLLPWSLSQLEVPAIEQHICEQSAVLAVLGIFGVLNFGSHSLLFCIHKGSICTLEQINLGAWKMDLSGDHRCEVYCVGENSLAHPSTAMWFLSTVTGQRMTCSECLQELSGTLYIFLSGLLRLSSVFEAFPSHLPSRGLGT